MVLTSQDVTRITGMEKEEVRRDKEWERVMLVWYRDRPSKREELSFLSRLGRTRR